MSDELPLLAGQGIGTRHEDDGLSYLPMPSDMQTFAIPILPEPEELGECPQTLALLERVQAALDTQRAGAPGQRIALDGLPERGITLLNQILGEGEVAIQIRGAYPAQIQETVLAGLWWIQCTNAEGQLRQQWLEVADIPALVLEHSFVEARWPVLESLPEGVLNGGPVLVELLEAASQQQMLPSELPHVVNLSLLPVSAADQQFLAEQLGEGPVLMLSRGYGNCRIASTATPSIWRVQYFNSTDQMILDTLEVTQIPQVACAAQEDLDDSAERLREMREALA